MTTLLTYVQAAELLTVSKRTVERMVAAGELPVTVVRGSRRISLGAVEEFVARSSVRDVSGAPSAARGGFRSGSRRVSAFRAQLRSVA